MEIQHFSKTVKEVADQYSKKFGVKYDGDWFPLKLQEELGEMTQKYLIMTNRTRRKLESEAEAKAALAEEIADTFSYVLLFADHVGVDVEESVKAKWFKYLD
jgi:NTP pyrophosphatase (non-canonical NTP hydrolase)